MNHELAGLALVEPEDSFSEDGEEAVEGTVADCDEHVPLLADGTGWSEAVALDDTDGSAAAAVFSGIPERGAEATADEEGGGLEVPLVFGLASWFSLLPKSFPMVILNELVFAFGLAGGDELAEGITGSPIREDLQLSQTR